MSLRFTWDPAKAAANRRKHGVDFREAMTAFADAHSLTIPDPDHSESEERWILIGQSDRQRLLVVSHIEHDDLVRLINARLASRSERKTYEEEA
jgi:uncharacterized DUF497 family protein